MYNKIKELFAGLGIGMAKRFFLYLFGGAPPTDDVESFRLWCLKNHRWIALVAQKTTNTWDDALSDMLLKTLQNEDVFKKLWVIATNTDSEKETIVATNTASGLFVRILKIFR